MKKPNCLLPTVGLETQVVAQLTVEAFIQRRPFYLQPPRRKSSRRLPASLEQPIELFQFR